MHRIYKFRLQNYHKKLPRRLALALQNALNMSPAPTMRQRNAIQVLDTIENPSLDESIQDCTIDDDDFEDELNFQDFPLPESVQDVEIGDNELSDEEMNAKKDSFIHYLRSPRSL